LSREWRNPAEAAFCSSMTEHHRQLTGQGDRSTVAVPQLAILLHKSVDQDAGPERTE
jgi:hypothetical protein